MTGSLRALLTGLIDYAGLFPPAALEMQPAVDAYARHRAGDHAWMLSHFICPAGRLEEFERCAAPRVTGGGPWTLSVLGRGGDTVDAFVASITEDLTATAALQARAPERFRAASLEVKLPAPLLAPDAGATAALLDGIAGGLADTGIDQLFLEVPADAHELLGVFAAIAAAGDGRPFTVAVKIRTGGVEASAFPTPERVAAFVIAARVAGLPFKATAGLHHPLRHFNGSVRAKMHGFLNVFAGAVLTAAGALGEGALVTLLDDEDIRRFRFDEDTLAYGPALCSTASVARAREGFALSYGSCSITEPIEDLVGLGLL